MLTAKEKKTTRKIQCERNTDMSQMWFAEGIIDAPHSKKDFHDELVPTVWVVVDMDGGSSGTGFCINQRGYILTCNHVCKHDVVHCSNLGPGDWFAQAKVVRRLPSWDMALLVLEDIGQRFDYVKMCDEQDQVFCGQDVYAIGNPNQLHKSFMIGKVGYSCDEFNPLDMDFEAAADSYNQASVHDPLVLHRTIGNTSSEGDFLTKNPNVPIIQIGRFCIDEGASGSPVFNKRGCVVGMHFACHGHQAFAIHFCALNHFINIVSPALDDEAHSSKMEKEKKGSKKGKKKIDR